MVTLVRFFISVLILINIVTLTSCMSLSGITVNLYLPPQCELDDNDSKNVGVEVIGSEKSGISKEDIAAEVLKNINVKKDQSDNKHRGDKVYGITVNIGNKSVSVPTELDASIPLAAF